MKRNIKLLTLIALTFSAVPAFAQSRAQAQKISQGSKTANHAVQRILQSVGHQGESLDFDEADDRAEPALMKAGQFLGKAAETAEQAILAYDAADVAQGNYFYAIACSQTGIARSAIGRANLAASTPPYGRLTAFGPQLTEILDEYTEMRIDSGCP